MNYTKILIKKPFVNYKKRLKVAFNNNLIFNKFLFLLKNRLILTFFKYSLLLKVVLLFSTLKKKIMNVSIIKVLRTFSEDEIYRFGLFLESPYFNNSKKLIKVYNELIKYYPGFPEENLSYEKIHESVSPELAFNQTTIKRLLFDLEKASLKFLKHSNFEKDFIESSENLRTELISRSLEKLFESNIETVDELFRQQKSFDPASFLSRSNIETDKMNLRYTSKRRTKITDISEMTDNLIYSSNFLLIFFTMKIVKHFLNLQSFHINYNNVENYNSVKEFTEKFIDSIDRKKLSELMKGNGKELHGIFELYYYLFKAFLEPENIEYYNKYKKLLFEKSDSLRKSEKHFLFNRLLDYGAIRRRNNPQDSSALKELLFLYEYFLRKKYYQSESSPYLSPTIFRNILVTGLKAGKISWTEKFVTIYSDKLHETFRNSMRNFGIARVRFAQKNFPDALHHLSIIDPDVFVLKIDIRNFLLMTYYEIGDYQTAALSLKSYRNFINRSKLIKKEKRDIYHRFADYINQLIRINNPKNRYKIKELKKRLAEDKSVIQREWLISKAESLDSVGIRAA